MLVVVGLAVVVGLVAGVGIGQRGRPVEVHGKQIEIPFAHVLEKTADHLNGDAEPPQRFVHFVEQVESVTHR
jgi:hypothetical protein